MRFLFCCEFYFPSVGGVQEVMRQVAERMVRRGHEVTVATTRLGDRNFTEHNGVKIAEFGVAGNLVRGMEGEVERYRAFVQFFDGDAILIKAAQQWTFDALWPVLDDIRVRKVFIPCGFSGLFEPTYVSYFEDMPGVLRKFDHLIFYAEQYRDVDFARKHGLTNFSILANGASEIEFGVEKDAAFRSAIGVPDDSAVLLTVGSLTGVKGHRELLEAFVRLKTTRRHVTFIMNGNSPPRPVVTLSSAPSSDGGAGGTEPPAPASGSAASRGGFAARGVRIFRQEGWAGIRMRIGLRTARVVSLARRVSTAFGKLASVHAAEGWLGVRWRIMRRLGPRMEQAGLIRWMPASLRMAQDPIAFWMAEASKETPGKKLIVSDFPRDTLVQAYMAADLFVFASNIEYSPLVLFEAAAAGTPFLSVPVGNADEIARWTGGGMLCPAEKDERGYTRVAPAVLAAEIAKAIESPDKLREMGVRAHAAWLERFTWDAVTSRYESILSGHEHCSSGARQCELV